MSQGGSSNGLHHSDKKCIHGIRNNHDGSDDPLYLAIEIAKDLNASSTFFLKMNSLNVDEWHLYFGQTY